MKKLTLALSLTTALTSTVFASTGLELSGGYEYGKAASDAASLVVRPYTDVGNYELGLRLENYRVTGNGDIRSTIEPQVTRMIGDKFKYGATAGVGMVTATGGSFSYYSVEPKVSYEFSPVTLKASVRYRDLADHSNPYQFETLTYTVGADYKLNDKTVVGLQGYEQNLSHNATGAMLSLKRDF